MKQSQQRCNKAKGENTVKKSDMVERGDMRRSRGKTVKREDGQEGRWSRGRTVKREDGQDGRRSRGKIVKREDGQEER